MAAQQATSATLDRILAQAAGGVVAAAARPVETGQIDLPPGINNGVCQITGCGFFVTKDNSNAKKADETSAVGSDYWQATAVVVEPEFVEHNGRKIKVKGRQTRLFVPLYDTKTGDKVVTVPEHIGVAEIPARKNVMNELKKLGATQEVFKACAGNLKKISALVEKAKPHFHFSTSVRKAMKEGDPDGVWENWNGNEGLEVYTPREHSKEEVLDESAHAPPPSANGTAKANPNPATVSPTTAYAATTEYRDDTDLVSLVERAERDADKPGYSDEDSEAACEALRQMAYAKGKTKQEVLDADNWEQVKGWIEGGTTTDAAPAIEDTVLYSATKGGRKTDHVVLAVNEEAKTVQLKNSDTKKIVVDAKKKPVNVPWAEIERT